MVRFDNLWKAPAIGALTGIVAGIFYESVAFSLIMFFTVSIITFILMFYFKAFTGLLQDEQSFLEKEKKFIEVILKLAAVMTKADGEITKSEQIAVEQQITAQLGEDEHAYFLSQFREYLTVKINIAEICKVVDYEFDEASKTHLVYLLLAIATADGILADQEIETLRKIAKHAEINMSTIVTTLKLFSFQRQQHHYKKRSNQRQQQSKTPPRQEKTRLTEAYELLELKANCSAAEIKSRYRKLAKLHHPDKVTHLGSRFQTAAKRKFQLISDAYTLIKQSRNMA